MKDPFEHGPSPTYFLQDQAEALTGVVRPPEPDCASGDHDYTHVVTGTGELILLHCARCDTRWRVEKQ